MKKVAILTFHASHNYGSVLQAYALQKTILSFGLECDIINFRSHKQKEVYSIITKRKGLKYLFKNIARILNYRQLKKKHQKFEKFIVEELKLTPKEYNTLTELENENFDYDFYICGSDQIWNPVPEDFDWAYYLPFTDSPNKISYAPSLGQLSSLGDEKSRDKISGYLNQFKYLSVRESDAAEKLSQLSGREITTVVDPTLLLSEENWKELSGGLTNTKYEYIFLYTLFASPEIIKIAKFVSKKLKLPVVVANFTNQYDIITPFIKKYHSGPIEFLQLICNAKLVLTSSFHGTVFSIKFKKDFFAINGMDDARINTLLTNVGLTERTISISNWESQIQSCSSIDYKTVEDKLNNGVSESLHFLRKALRTDDYMQE